MKNKELLKKSKNELTQQEFLVVAFLDGHNVSENFGALSKKVAILEKMLRFSRLNDQHSWNNIMINIFNNCQDFVMSKCLTECLAGLFTEKEFSKYTMSFLLGANNKRDEKEVKEIINNFLNQK